MTLLSFTASDFRCLESVTLEANPGYNLVYGSNASGKTSLLEAIAYLGRGKSFRGASTEQLLRHGAREFLLRGRVQGVDRVLRLGVRNGSAGLEISTDGDRGGGAAALAEVLPLQIVDPDVHDLVAAGPDGRRRYLDWMAFHVEQGYLALWRDFRRALRQRNTVLRQDTDTATLAGWDREFEQLGHRVDEVRARVLESARQALESTGRRLLGEPVGFEYQRGWAADQSLAAALQANRQRDRQLGSTQSGPQRADIRLSSAERQARKRVSRGQQKLLACTLILSATAVVQAHLGRPLLLLLDDPAAELDRHSLGRLMEEVSMLRCQVIATALQADDQLFPEAPALFHVEQGALNPVR
ncbi:MAG: DNA replication/repair protein RecF [Woeseia sp.]